MTGYESKKAAALDEDGMYLVHHTKRKDEAGKAAQQEPDAIGCQCAECGEWQKWTPSGMVCKNGHGGASGINQRLYTTPPADDTQVYKDHGDALTIAYQSGYYDGKKAAQRPWVDLTEHELFSIWMMVPETEDRFAFARAVLAKSKELNT